jgi:hypothetical protein
MGGAPSAILIWSMGIPHWMLPLPATKRRRHGAQESRTVGGAAGRVRRPSDRRLRGGAPSRSGDLCGPSNGEDCRGVAVAVVTGRPGTGTHPRAGLANLPRQRCPGLEVWGSTSPRLQRLRSSPERLRHERRPAAIPRSTRSGTARLLSRSRLWLLGRNPLVADLAHRIPGVVTTGPRAPRTTRRG